MAPLWLLLVSGCASSDPSRGLSGSYDDDGSNAHPAAYVTERFPVNRPFPKKRSGPSVPFYFKKCEMAGDNWPFSRTSYDCDYP